MSNVKKYDLLRICIIPTVTIFLLAYLPTLFNFFIADDFSFLIWARKAVSCPEILLAKYSGPYTIEPVMFYRPILYTVMFLGYKLWNLNGLCFRLVNMVAELLAGLLLGLIIVALSKNNFEQSPLSKRQIWIWAVYTALFFVLFPSHSESVNWVTLVTNPLVGFFTVFTFWCYIKWRTASTKTFWVLSIISTILAFLTRETVTFPPINGH